MSIRVTPSKHEEKALDFIEYCKDLKGVFSLGTGAVVVNLPLFLETQKTIILTKPSQRQYNMALYHLGEFKKTMSGDYKFTIVEHPKDGDIKKVQDLTAIDIYHLYEYAITINEINQQSGLKHSKMPLVINDTPTIRVKIINYEIVK